MSTTAPAKPKRPIAIAISGWILFIGALLNILIGILFLYAAGGFVRDPDAVIIFTDEDLAESEMHQEQLITEGVIDLVLGIVQLAITIGFLRVQHWAWVAAMSWQAVKLLFEIASVLLGGGTLIAILFACLLVFLLNQSDVRRAFNIRRQENEPSSVTTLGSFDSN